MENDVYIQVAMDILEGYHAHDVMTGISRGISHRKKTPAPKCGAGIFVAHLTGSTRQ